MVCREGLRQLDCAGHVPAGAGRPGNNFTHFWRGYVLSKCSLILPSYINNSHGFYVKNIKRFQTKRGHIFIIK